MKVLVFDIWADLGHFRKFYTTTSPLTFAFPPPPTIAGILGCITGLEKSKNEYLAVHKESKMAVRLLNPVKKIRLGLNLLETKGKNRKLPMSDKNRQPRTQIRTEFLKNPKFRIFVNIRDHINFKHLIDRIQTHQSVFTVSMGLSELLANFEFVSLLQGEEINNINKAEIVDISTPITMMNLMPNGLIIEEGKKYFKEKIPIRMNSERTVEFYDDVIYEPDSHLIKARVKQYCRLENGENITFF